MKAHKHQRPDLHSLTVTSDELLTEKQAAAWLHISISTLRRWRRKAGPTPFRQGKIVRYRARDLARFIDTNLLAQRAQDRAEEVL